MILWPDYSQVSWSLAPEITVWHLCPYEALPANQQANDASYDHHKQHSEPYYKSNHCVEAFDDGTKQQEV